MQSGQDPLHGAAATSSRDITGMELILEEKEIQAPHWTISKLGTCTGKMKPQNIWF